MPLITDPDLDHVLTHAGPDDLSILADFITDKGAGRLSLSGDICNVLNQSSLKREFPPQVRAIIAEELQRFGGNSVMNLFRGGSGVQYREIVMDVADHIKAPYKKNDDCIQIEMGIIVRVLEQSMEKMIEEQRKEVFDIFGQRYTGLGPGTMAALSAGILTSSSSRYKLATLVANASVSALLGRGLVLGASSTALRSVGALAGPLGWAVTAIWTVFDLASPAHRVTVPSVIQIAYMRHKPLALNQNCSQCSAPLAAGAKFCSNCGRPVAIAVLPA